MAEKVDLKQPWLVAVWPGMGQVAISAGYFLMAKLGMHLLAPRIESKIMSMVFLAGGKGMSLIIILVITPRVPSLPTISRVRS